MCGRAAQTYEAVSVAGAALLKTSVGCRISGASTNDGSQNQQSSNTNNKASNSNQASLVTGDNETSFEASFEDHHNYNLSPGMDAFVFWYDNKTGEIRVDKKVWGIVTKGGTPSAPIPEGMGKHFEGLMFNARSDTLYEKTTFSRLARSGKSCLVVLDGFFEWKSEVKGRKQPYFVYRNTKSNDESSKRPYLLMPGLWTSVPTGRSENPVLETFTIITTDVCKPLKWLHTRMPITLWDDNLAMMWLKSPNESIHRQMDEAAQATPDDYLAWHAVTPDMTSMKFRSEIAIKPLPKMKTVKSFFVSPLSSSSSSKNSTTAKDIKATGKRQPDETISSSSQGKLTSVFQTPSKNSSIDDKPSINLTTDNSKSTREKRPIDKISSSSPAKASISSSPNVPNSSSNKKPKPGTIDSFFKRK